MALRFAGKSTSQLLAELGSEDRKAFFRDLDVAVELLPHGFRPIGPLGGKLDRFSVRHRTDGKRFTFPR